MRVKLPTRLRLVKAGADRVIRLLPKVPRMASNVFLDRTHSRLADSSALDLFFL